jgi:hypothetical protein
LGPGLALGFIPVILRENLCVLCGKNEPPGFMKEAHSTISKNQSNSIQNHENHKANTPAPIAVSDLSYLPEFLANPLLLKSFRVCL